METTLLLPPPDPGSASEPWCDGALVLPLAASFCLGGARVAGRWEAGLLGAEVLPARTPGVTADPGVPRPRTCDLQKGAEPGRAGRAAGEHQTVQRVHRRCTTAPQTATAPRWCTAVHRVLPTPPSGPPPAADRLESHLAKVSFYRRQLSAGVLALFVQFRAVLPS